MFTRGAILQLGIALLLGCTSKDEQACPDGEFKTVEGDCVADTGRGDGGGGGPSDEPPEPVKETGGEQIETAEPEETGVIRETGDPGELEITVEWSADGLWLGTGLSGGYGLGMVETDPRSADPYTYEDGRSASVLHTFEGDELRLACVEDAAEVVAGETTRMCSVDPAYITYYLTTADLDACWIWGHDVTYYMGMGCTTL